MEAIGGQIPAPEMLDTEDAVREFVAYADQFDYFALDTETTGISITKDRALFASCAAGNRRACFPIRLMPLFRPLLSGPKLKVFQNSKFDLHMLANTGLGLDVADPIADTMVMSVRENSARPYHDLKFLASDGLYERFDPRYVKYGTFKSLFGKGKPEEALLAPENRDKVAGYASMDAWVTLLAFQELHRRLATTPAPLTGNLWELYKIIEMPMTRLLYEYERAGFLINAPALEAELEPVKKEADDLSRRASRMLGQPINLSSPKQVADVLINQLGYPPVKYSKGGRRGTRQPSVDDDVVRAWQRLPQTNKELLDILLEHRDLTNQKGKLTEISKALDPTNRLHTTINQGAARTGRLSSSKPALQNLRKKFRNLFVAPEDWDVVDFDLDQIEMRLAAIFSRDSTMIDCFRRGIDVHSKTVELMDDIPYEEVAAAHSAKKPTPRQEELERLRTTRKKTGFGILYGETEYKLITQVPVPGETRQERLEAGRRLQQAWLDAYPGVREFVEQTKKWVQGEGYITTILGWRRHLPAGKLAFPKELEWKERDPEFNEAMRQAVNSIVQGSAADVMKVVQILIWRDPELRSLPCVPLLPVHDELVSVARRDVSKRVLERQLELAFNPLRHMGLELPVDLKASGNIGTSWKDA